MNLTDSPTASRFSAAPATEVELFSLGGHDGHLREVNGSFAALLGLDADQINGHSVLEFVHPEDITQVVAGIAALERGQSEVLMETRFLPFGGQPVHLQWVARPVPGTDTWWAAGRDTTEFHHLLAQRHTLRTSLDLALGQTAAAMWDLDMTTGVLTWEDQAAPILGVTSDAVPTTPDALAAAVTPADSAAVTLAIQQLRAAGTTDVDLRIGDDSDIRHLTLRGRVITRDRRNRPLRAIGLILDVTAEKAMQEQMLRMVLSDPLTGIPNRRAFDQTLRTESRRCTKAARPLSVLMIDIDHFKTFNDTYGHLVGDAALIAVARVLSATLQQFGGYVARYGGEEFAVIMADTNADQATRTAERLLAAVRTVTVRQAADWNATVSIGSATWIPGSPLTKATEVLAYDDTALYLAKKNGRDQLQSAS